MDDQRSPYCRFSLTLRDWKSPHPPATSKIFLHPSFFPKSSHPPPFSKNTKKPTQELFLKKTHTPKLELIPSAPRKPMPRARRPPCRFREEIDSDHDADIDGSQDDGGLQEEVNEDDEGIKHTKAYACETCHYKKSGENSRSYCTGRQCKDSEDFGTVMQICPIWQIGNTNAFQRKHQRAWAAYKNAEKKAKSCWSCKRGCLKESSASTEKTEPSSNCRSCFCWGWSCWCKQPSFYETRTPKFKTQKQK